MKVWAAEAVFWFLDRACGLIGHPGGCWLLNGDHALARLFDWSCMNVRWEGGDND